MADFVVQRHSAVMERLRRRIEMFRRHHNGCEARYEAVTADRLEIERQQTYMLHQRFQQTKAKRAKHRQQQPSTQQHPATGESNGLRCNPMAGAGSETGEVAGVEQTRSSSSTLIALHETVKKKLESAASPQNGDQQNGYGDNFSVPKKMRLDEQVGGVNGSSTGKSVSPLHHLDSKPPNIDTIQLNGNHSLGMDATSKNNCLSDNLQRLDDADGYCMVKQEPMDGLPCMISGTGGSMTQNILMPELNLNEQDWKELIEELNRSVPDEYINDLFTEEFEEKKDTESSASAAQTPLPLDIVNIKTEFSPANSEPEQRGSPQMRPNQPGSSFLNAPSVPVSAASPVVGNSQPLPQAPNQIANQTFHQPSSQGPKQPQPGQRATSGITVPGQSTGSSKEMTPAQQLQQIAAKQNRAQLIQNQQQAQKFNQSSHVPNWAQSGPSPNTLGGPFVMEKSNSTSVYQQDFNNPKLINSGMSAKSSSRSGNNYVQLSHVNMLSHQSSNLNQNPVSNQNSMLNYGNTKPLTHFEVDCGQEVTQPNQNKAALLAYLQQQQRQPPQLSRVIEEQKRLLVKQKTGLNYQTLVSHSQDQNTTPNVTRVPVSVPGPNVGTQPPVSSISGSHGNATYLANQQQAALKHQMLLDQQKQREQQQHIILEQQKHQYIMGQRQQLLAEQEKQRQQQEQQLQRHLTRPPPQYQDQQQNPYQQQVNQFQGSSQGHPNVGSLGPAASSSPRMFPQNQGMMQMSQNQSQNTLPPNPSTSTQQEMMAAPYANIPNVQQGGIYNLGSSINQMLTPTAQNSMNNGQAQIQRQSSIGQSGTMPPGYGQNLLGNSNLTQQHNKGPVNPSLAKPQLARMPAPVGVQNSSWQHQGIQNMNSQTQGNSTLGAFNASSSFHLQQTHPKMSGQQFTQGMSQTGLSTARPVTSINTSVTGQIISSLNGPQRTNSSAQQQQQVIPGVTQTVPDTTNFAQTSNQQMASRASIHCSQSYQVRTPTQDLAFGFSSQTASTGLQSLPGDAELMDSLLKNRTTEEWMNDLDEFLGTH
ncbi:mastermind-like protein 1 [Protopterus annectens]|uniref:mastermind-like protein 1 n=1 Tax=Protopterus annectens TaxID=7888 RepID=UPI001CFA7E4C|nr:mastermind-like protein 1 [Protopterus annectens]